MALIGAYVCLTNRTVCKMSVNGYDRCFCIRHNRLRRRVFDVPDVILGAAVEAVSVPVLAGERALRVSGAVQPQLVITAVGRNVDVVAADAGAFRIILARPTDCESPG